MCFSSYICTRFDDLRQKRWVAFVPNHNSVSRQPEEKSENSPVMEKSLQRRIFKMCSKIINVSIMRKLLSLIAMLVMSVTMLMAQTKTVTGSVISAEDGEPIIGASVVLTGTTTGIITDFDGNFSLNVPENASTLTVSFVGMETQTVNIGKGKIYVTLSSNNQVLDEVMVVAYGTAKKSELTGSVTTMKAENIQKLQVSNVSKALEGSAPGVQVASQSGQPGSDATIRIRGIGSINASSNPLYVVDGMPFDGNINSINPADIASMSVLKDAASTALYGSRAANGVIVITTKKGAIRDKSKVTFEGRVGINTRGVPEYDIMKDPGEYMKTFWSVLKNQNKGDGAAASAALVATLGYNPYLTDNNSVVDANGNLTTAALRYNDNWKDEAFENGMRQEYNVNIQGGNTKASHFLSMGYLKDEGIIANSDYSRFSLRANGDYEINKYLSLNGSAAYSRGEQNSQAISNLDNYVNSFMFTQFIAPIYPVYAYDAQGNRVYNADGSTIYDFGDGKYGSRAWGSNQNVVASDDANMNRRISDNFSGRFGAKISFLNDFTFQANMGYDMTNTARDQFQTPSFGDAQASGGRGYKYRYRTQTYTINQLLSYTKNFDKHHLDVLLGHETYDYKYEYLYNAKTKFFDAEIPQYNNAITMESMDSYDRAYNMESYLGRLNYDFDNKYYLSASLRRDGSSRFSKDNRWGTFWSVGTRWRLTQEDFMKDFEWLDDAAVRASYGSVGNDDIYYPDTSTSNFYANKTQYVVTNSDGQFAVSKYYTGNDDLTWETSYNFNVGFSASLFNRLLDVDFEYFAKKTEDMLYNVPQPRSSGVAFISENALTMVNKGIEFSLGVNVPMPKDMRWSWTFTGTHYTNEVTDIPENKHKDGITNETYYNIREGRSVYDFYYYEFAGVDPTTGKSLWYADSKDAKGNVILDEKGNVVRTTTSDYSKADKYYIGSALPKFQGGITTEYAWKGFDVSVSANYQFGGKIYDSMYTSLMHAGKNAGYNWHRDILNAWTAENPNSNIPILDGDQTANTVSSRFLVGADYFNLRNITFGYTFPKKMLHKIMCDNARVYFVADNVALKSKRKGMDPRQYISGQSRANYSAIRTLSVGLSLQF